jgi:uncharacterized membrane protein
MTPVRDGSERVLLLRISLALNVFFVALIVAHMLRPHLARPQPTPATNGVVARLTAALPADDAAQFRARLNARRADFDPQRARIDTARQALLEAIARDPYETDAVRQALADYQQSWRDFTRHFNPAFLAALEAVSPAGRAQLAAAAETAHR